MEVGTVGQWVDGLIAVQFTGSPFKKTLKHHYLKEKYQSSKLG
jgi:hypothetical protein